MNQTKATHAYREAAIRGASQIELVIIMYDMVIEDLKHAIDAVRSNNIEQRTRETKHVLSVLEQLQGTLDMAHGGDAAVTMDHLYSIARGKIMEANIKSSVEILQDQVRVFADLKSAWQQVQRDRKAASPAEALSHMIPASNLPKADATSASCEWSV